MAVAAPGACPVPYCRRRPEHTVLYRLVQEHLETYLALARDGDGSGQGVPRSVERVLPARLHLISKELQPLPRGVPAPAWMPLSGVHKRQISRLWRLWVPASRPKKGVG